MRILAVVPLLVALSGGAVARASDLTIRQRVTGPMANETAREETQYWTATQRITDSSGARRIVDLSARTMTIVTKSTKTYQVVTFDEIQRQTKAFQARLDSLPPEARKVIDGDVSIKPSGKTSKILGYNAAQYLVTSELASGDMWTTEDLTPPGDLTAWQEALTAMSGGNGPGGKLASSLAQLKGVPLRSTFTTVIGANKMTVITDVLDVSTKAPPTDFTTIPAGFEKAVLPARPAPGGELDQ